MSSARSRITSNSTTTGAQVDRYTLFIFSHVVEPFYSATCLTMPPQFQRDARKYEMKMFTSNDCPIL